MNFTNMSFMSSITEPSNGTLLMTIILGIIIVTGVTLYVGNKLYEKICEFEEE